MGSGGTWGLPRASFGRSEGDRGCFLFLGVLRCFSSPGCLPGCPGLPPMTAVGLPHSGTPGSTPARGSPGRIVVRHALRRLSAPRHPPVALCSLIDPKWFFLMALPLTRRSSPFPPREEQRQPQVPREPKAPLCIPVRLTLLPVCSFQGARSQRLPVLRSSTGAPVSNYSGNRSVSTSTLRL